MNLKDLRIEDMDKLFYMDMFYPVSTGVETILWVSPGFFGHKPKIKVGKRGQDASISIEDEPKILAGSISETLFKQIVKWIKLNKTALLSYWNEEIDSVSLVYNLRKI